MIRVKVADARRGERVMMRTLTVTDDGGPAPVFLFFGFDHPARVGTPARWSRSRSRRTILQPIDVTYDMDGDGEFDDMLSGFPAPMDVRGRSQGDGRGARGLDRPVGHPLDAGHSGSRTSRRWASIESRPAVAGNQSIVATISVRTRHRDQLRLGRR